MLTPCSRNNRITDGTFVYLRSLDITNFRSFSSRRFEFSPGLNLLFGPNACGKTNLLEAIHVLSNLRSFRTRLHQELINWDATEAYVQGVVTSSPGAEQIRSSTKSLAVNFQADSRIASLNSKRCKSSKTYLQVLPSSVFVPDNLELIKGTPASRRFFMDRGTFFLYPPHWSLLIEYNKTLRQKNALLRDLQTRKAGGQKRGHATSSSMASLYTMCETWNTQLQVIGSKIITQRLLFIRNVARLLEGIYSEWLDTKEMIDVDYKSTIKLTKEDTDTLEQIPKELLLQRVSERYGHAIQKNQDREYRLGTTVVGPHRDDLTIYLDGKPARSYGSQGQQRTAVLALKLAETQLYFEQYAEYPILLLDDVTSELDRERNTKLFEYLRKGMQVFVSATGKHELPFLQPGSCAYFDLS